MESFKIVLLLACFSVSFVPFCSGVNILWISGLASPSHQIWVSLLQRTLASRGHNITHLSVDKPKREVENLTALHMEGVYEFYFQKEKNLTEMSKNNPINDIIDIANFRSDSCEPAFKSEGVGRLMEYPVGFKFDLVVHDFAASHCLLGFVPRFGSPPLVGVSASTCPIGISAVSGNHQFPSFIPTNHLSIGYSMSLMQTVYNYFLYIIDNLVRTYYMYPKQNKMARKFFGIEKINVEEISASSVLSLVNLSPVDVMQPFFQNVIPVGGMHIEEPEPLESELKMFADKHEVGLVYFALGTNIKSEHFTSVQVEYFLEAFTRFPHHGFLWKYDPGQMRQALPTNVMIRKWMPQNNILAHPSLKAFISHGGALSCHEAAWYGVPQLLMPFIIDQKHNSASAAERGVALVLDKDSLSADIIVDALHQILYNESFKINVNIISQSFRDQPQTPLERAVFWMEYAVRHGREFKLRSPAQEFGFYSKLAKELLKYLIFVYLIIFSIKRLNIYWFYQKKELVK